MLPITTWEDKAKDLFRLRVHSDALAISGDARAVRL